MCGLRHRYARPSAARRPRRSGRAAAPGSPGPELFMEHSRLYSLSTNEDMTIINVRSKLLVLENMYINQKMVYC